MSDKDQKEARRQQLVREGQAILYMDDWDAMVQKFKKWETNGSNWLDDYYFDQGYAGELIALGGEEIDGHLGREDSEGVKQVIRLRIKWLSDIGRFKRGQGSGGGTPDRVFIGHGRSLQWLVLKDFLENRLQLKVEEFNRVSSVGIAVSQRLSGLLDSALFAFLVMTAEDEQIDKSKHARENVIHEVGFFQGRLGFPRAATLVEDGCEMFSNMDGLGHIKFPQGNISTAFEEVRKVLERERIVSSSAGE